MGSSYISNNTTRTIGKSGEKIVTIKKGNKNTPTPLKHCFWNNFVGSVEFQRSEWNREIRLKTWSIPMGDYL